MIGRYGNRICSFEENAYLIETKYIQDYVTGYWIY